jgi:DNA-binding NarL/FixJ family response regulator
MSSTSLRAVAVEGAVGFDGDEVIVAAASGERFDELLTPREIDVLELVSEGLGNREIGRRLFLSEETVKSHIRNILAKFQARSRAHAVALPFRHGLIA